MATLNVRNIPEDLYARLRVRAAEAGESMEGFVRKRLVDLVREPAATTEQDAEPKPGSLTPNEAQARFRALFGDSPPEGLVDELLAERRREAEREESESSASSP